MGCPAAPNIYLSLGPLCHFYHLLNTHLTISCLCLLAVITPPYISGSIQNLSAISISCQLCSYIRLRLFLEIRLVGIMLPLFCSEFSKSLPCAQFYSFYAAPSMDHYSLQVNSILLYNLPISRITGNNIILINKLINYVYIYA